ncbi:hypothetical protein GDO86_018907 [Hymenochirus boettgeri]|nr:hypothetical protein GDO86_018907 [Hymenochirus boettgeri]
MTYAGYPAGYPTTAPTYNPNMYAASSPGYAPATLLMKQAWPQTSSSCSMRELFHLPVDTGTEKQNYQASSAAFTDRCAVNRAPIFRIGMHVPKIGARSGHTAICWQGASSAVPVMHGYPGLMYAMDLW